MSTLFRPFARRLARVVLVALAGLTMALGLQIVSVGTADAYTISSQGVTTAQRPTIYKVIGTHVNIGTPASPQWVRRLTQSGPVVRHTGSGGDEVFKVTYRVYKSTGSGWSQEKAYAASRTLSAGVSSLQMPPLRHDSFSRGYFYVQVQLTSTTPIGGLQSSFTATMNQAGDYTCNSQFQCTIPGGYIYLS